jgi:uncharacterized membrane protein YhhN
MSMATMTTVFLILFIAAAVLHLVSILAQKPLLKALSKGSLMPLLLGFYVLGADKIFWPVVLALFLGGAGDIFLLNINSLKFFRLGLASFLLGHICYIIALLVFPFNNAVLVISIAVAAALGIVMYRFVHPSREMRIPVIVYETVIMGMVIFALQTFLVQGPPSGALVLAGSLLFLVSDSILARFTFGKKPVYGDFWVMLTYIPAQFCLVLGFYLSAV